MPVVRIKPLLQMGKLRHGDGQRQKRGAQAQLLVYCTSQHPPK